MQNGILARRLNLHARQARAQAQMRLEQTLNKAAILARAKAKFCKFQAAARVKFQTPIKLQNRELLILLNLTPLYRYKTPFVLGTPARSLILIARRKATANALNAASATWCRFSPRIWLI